MAVKHLLTQNGEKLFEALSKDPAYCPWNIYPRPQMKRDSFFCLNGKWSFHAGNPKNTPEESILVPFPPESRLSGICRDMGHDPSVYYKRNFRLPDGFIKDRVLLHFGAVDQIARVLINGKEAGDHEGGYDAFSFDITEFLQEENTIEVFVKDNLSDKTLPYGKQSYKRGGMWYTPVTGIWQTVWIESVPQSYIRQLSVISDEDNVKIIADGVSDAEICIQTPFGELFAKMKNGTAEIRIPTPHKWTPVDPYLYEFSVSTDTDTVHSYFALRTVSISEINGIPRICLNGKPIFLHGLLDQGYFSDGIFTPASPESYTEDILAMKKLGFNTLRKHIKVEPEQFYYDCDRLGMLVIQDMVNNSDYSFIRDTALPTVGIRKLSDRHMHNSQNQRKSFVESLRKTIRQLHNHPCIITWTVFNEGWGQFNGSEMYDIIKKIDQTRIIDTASGWFGGVKSDVESIHVYFKPVRIPKSEKPVLLSEFGGYSCKIPDHSFNTEKNYGYRFFHDQEEFADALYTLYKQEIVPVVDKGLCGAVYTQVSDVEDETNGLLTYDRKVCKVSEKPMKSIAERLFEEIGSDS